MRLAVAPCSEGVGVDLDDGVGNVCACFATVNLNGVGERPDDDAFRRLVDDYAVVADVFIGDYHVRARCERQRLSGSLKFPCAKT